MKKKYISIDSQNRVNGVFEQPQEGIETYEILASRLEALKRPWKYQPGTDKLTTNEAALRPEYEKLIISEHERLSKLLQVTTNKGTFSATQGPDINALLLMIEQSMIQDGEARLSDVDKRLRPTLTVVQLKEIGALIATARNNLAELRKAKHEELDACTSEEIQSFDPLGGWSV